MKIKNSELPCLGQTLRLSHRQKASSFREAAEEETSLLREAEAALLQSCGYFRSRRPRRAGRAPLPGAPGTQCQALGGLERNLVLASARPDGMGDGKLSVPSHGELDPVPKPREVPVLTPCSAAALALGGEHCASGLLRTVDMLAGTRVSSRFLLLWKAPAVRKKQRDISPLSWIFHG